MAGTDWSDQENDLTVAAYFEMLEAELRAQDFVKSDVRKALLPRLSDRSDGAIEFKFQNVSAVMLTLGQPRIEGYKPATRFQRSLIDAVLRQLKGRDWLALIRTQTAPAGLAEPPALWIGPPPTHSNSPPPVDPALIEFVARHFDVAGRDDRNRRLGEAGEALILANERRQLAAAGEHALASRIRWVSREDGDGAGYDILSYEPNGAPRLIEVKTTNGWERTPFHISKTEVAVADANRDHWHLIRVWNFVREPKAFSIRPPLDAHATLTPTSFLASLH